MLTLMPIEICAKAAIGIETNAPVNKAVKRSRIREGFIRNYLFSPFMRETLSQLRHAANQPKRTRTYQERHSLHWVYREL
jgi:hypothetical protein